jgi:hypothetical protein
MDRDSQGRLTMEIYNPPIIRGNDADEYFYRVIGAAAKEYEKRPKKSSSRNRAGDKSIRDEVIKEVEFLKSKDPSRYDRFVNGENLDDLMQERESDRRLRLAVRSGALR